MTRCAPALLMLLLAGCTVGPDYRAPEMAVPPGFSAGQTPAAATSEWWKGFEDPTLDSLVARALAGNLDIRQAASRVVQARAQERAVRAGGGPSLNAGAQAGYTRLSANSIPSSIANFGDPTNGNSSGFGLPGEGFANFLVGFDASWELDLFGGQRRANEAARARTEAAVWQGRDAEVTLTAEVARQYFELRGLQRRMAIADGTIASARELLEILNARAKNGLSSTIDSRRQERDLARLVADRQGLAAEAEARMHALGVLLGQPPLSLAEELAGAGGPPKAIEVPAGLPSQLLERRPDVRAAERRLAAATADIGVATADLYPKFSLTGALQLVSRSLSTMLETDSILARGAGGFSLPLLGRGASRATVELRTAQADEALIAWQGDVLGAMRDVEDALSRLDAARKRVEQLSAAERAARDAMETALVQNRHGLTGFIEVIEAQQALWQASDALAQAEGAQAGDTVALYKALGGGWDERRITPETEAKGG